MAWGMGRRSRVLPPSPLPPLRRYLAVPSPIPPPTQPNERRQAIDPSEMQYEATFRDEQGRRVEVVVSEDYDPVHEPTVVVRYLPEGDDIFDEDPDKRRDHLPVACVDPSTLTPEEV